MSEYKIRLGITQGDPNGIGCEVIIKALLDSRMTELCTPVIYGSSKAIGIYKRTVEESESFVPNVISSAKDAHSKKVNLVNVGNDELRIDIGRPSSESGATALKALEIAVSELQAGLIDAIVTAPICKENIQSDKFNFKGHTEYFADCFGGTPLMMMCSQNIKVGLVTTHIALKDVASTITTEAIATKIGELREALKQDFMIVEPQIAVLSINPHVGDGGLIGDEDDQIVTPAIKQAREQGALAFGPFAADGFFAAGNYTKYDAVLAMYHDQGLIPFKTLTNDGVNFTAGLPIVRTSPDHGTGFDIAGKGVADAQSMRNAIYMAIDICRNRNNYDKMTSNPLQRYKRESGADVSIKDLKLPEDND